jgi:catechol-2,3-dioxygenase
LECWSDERQKAEIQQCPTTPSLQANRRLFIATLRYVAFLAQDPSRLADFYQRFLGTEELGRSPEGDVSITDGYYNLTFFKRRPALGEMRMDLGLHHIGLEVDKS